MSPMRDNESGSHRSFQESDDLIDIHSYLPARETPGLANLRTMLRDTLIGDQPVLPTPTPVNTPAGLGASQIASGVASEVASQNASQNASQVASQVASHGASQVVSQVAGHIGVHGGSNVGSHGGSGGDIVGGGRGDIHGDDSHRGSLGGSHGHSQSHSQVATHRASHGVSQTTAERAGLRAPSSAIGLYVPFRQTGPYPEEGEETAFMDQFNQVESNVARPSVAASFHHQSQPTYEQAGPSTREVAGQEPRGIINPANRGQFDPRPQINLDHEHSLFVGHLGPEVDEAMLWEAFGPRYQSFIKANLMRNRGNGRTKGYAFIRFTDRADLEHALQHMHGFPIGNSRMRVNRARKELTRGPGQQEAIISQSLPKQALPMNVPYGDQVGHILGIAPPEPALAWHGGQFFQSQLSVPVAPDIQFPAGMNPFMPPSSLSALAEPFCPQAPLDISQSFMPAGGLANPRNATVFVGALPEDSTREQLQEIFSGAGEIAHIHILARKGCGFVRFTSHEDAVRAMTTRSGVMLNGSRLRLAWGQHANKNKRQ